MIDFYVSGQQIKFYTPVIAADTLNYLTAHFSFTDSEWDGYTKWAHFRQGDTVYDIELNDDNGIDSADALQLTVGEWTVYLTGTRGDARLTTVPVILTVKESGLIDAPLHALPQSVAEQIDDKASQALLLAQTVRDMAAAGSFDGTDGQSFVILGYFDTLTELASEVTSPEAGAVYGVGQSAPYNIYVWDARGGAWVDNGTVQGVPGAQGAPGTVFTPSVDEYGNLSWTNDGGLENPVTRNITGPAGAQGAAGAAGASAFDKAVEAGYTGTEATFYSSLTSMPYHNARHLPDGADPITVRTDNIAAAAVTQNKLAAHAVSTLYTATVPTAGWTDNSGYHSIVLSVAGLAAEDEAIIDINTADVSVTAATVTDIQWAFSSVYRMTVGDGTLTVEALDEPTAAIPIKILCIRR